MAKSIRAEKREPAENETKGNVMPERVAFLAAIERGLAYHDELYARESRIAKAMRDEYNSRYAEDNYV